MKKKWVKISSKLREIKWKMAQSCVIMNQNGCPIEFGTNGYFS